MTDNDVLAQVLVVSEDLATNTLEREAAIAAALLALLTGEHMICLGALARPPIAVQCALQVYHAAAPGRSPNLGFTPISRWSSGVSTMKMIS